MTTYGPVDGEPLRLQTTVFVGVSKVQGIERVALAPHGRVPLGTLSSAAGQRSNPSEGRLARRLCGFRCTQDRSIS